MTTTAKIGFVLTCAAFGFIGGAVIGGLFGITLLGALFGAGFCIGKAVDMIRELPKHIEC